MVDTTEKIKDARIELPDGMMHYQVLGKGSSLVLMHSMANSVRSWAKVLEPLAQQHTVYALDTMGQGDSGEPIREYKTMENYAGSVIDFMNAKGISKATLVGNSVGAIFAIQIAASKPAMVDRLVLVGCPCRETEEERKEATPTMNNANYDFRGRPVPRRREDIEQSYTHYSLELHKQVNEDRLKAGVWGLFCSIAMNKFDIVPALEKISAKTLVVFGEKDALRSKENALKGHIKGSDLVIIKDAGHVPQVDNPEGFLEVVQSFLS